MQVRDELRSWRHIAELTTIAAGYHLVKLIGNLVDAEDGAIEQRVGQLLARRVLRYLDMQVEVIGAEKVRGLERYAVASTHASHVDWAVLLAYFPAPLRFIAKRELASVPVIGSYLRLRGVLVDRKRGIDARRAILAAVADEQPWPILIFPEGTRSRDGTVGPFRKGGLRLLAEAGLALVPVCILGTFEALPRGSHRPRTGCRLRLIIGEPVRPAEHQSVEAAIAELERRMRAAHAGAPHLCGSPMGTNSSRSVRSRPARS